MKEDFSPFRHYIIQHESGFMFPYLYFISTAIFTIIIGTISSLNTEQELIELKEEQFRLELLFQSGFNDFKNLQVEDINYSESITFTYPDGSVIVQYSKLDEATMSVLFRVRTKYQANQSVQLRIPFPGTNE